MVARTVKGMLGDTVFAEDIGQEVFINLFYSLQEFRGESKLSTYIQKIAVNLTLNEIKRRKRFFSMFSHKANNEMHEFEIADHDTEERKEASEIVNKALLAMDPKFRIIVTMRMLQGYSTKETAEILDLPIGTVLSRLSRAQEQLRIYFKKTMNKMNTSEIKNLIISSLNQDADTSEVSGRMEEEGISYNFSENFGDKVLDKLFSAGLTVKREVEFVKYMNFAFYRIALTGVAAIVILLISIFLMQGSLSINSFLGFSDSYDESIVCLLTGN